MKTGRVGRTPSILEPDRRLMASAPMIAIRYNRAVFQTTHVPRSQYPDEAFIVQAMRHLTDDIDGVLGRGRVLICDRDRKWSSAAVTPTRSASCDRSRRSASIA